jgi:hypothetical protein
VPIPKKDSKKTKTTETISKELGLKQENTGNKIKGTKKIGVFREYNLSNIEYLGILI